MKKTLFLILLSQFLFLSIVKANGKDTTGNFDSLEAEQMMLRWCFKFSNQFGFNISSISNPELYMVAGEWMGTPYKYGGRNKKGIDCSGFTCEVYKSALKKPINGSAQQLFKLSREIASSELKEGDLVFFKIRRKTISHVGIYLGENKFIHASLSNGVIVSDLKDPYYSKYFYKGGRIKE